MSWHITAISDRILSLAALAATVALVWGAAAMITTQYKIRQVFVEVETEKRIDRELQDDASKLNIDLARAGLPAAVNARAGASGFSNADLDRTVMIGVPKQRLDRDQMEVFIK